MPRPISFPPEFEKAVAGAAEAGVFPDGSPGRFLCGERAAGIARRYGLAPRQADEAALAGGVIPLRYVRNAKAFSPAEQLALLRSRTALIGLGGLGGHILELLVRAGAGTILCADGDVFEESNLNRQLLSEDAALGRDKAEAAVRRAGRINPTITVTAYREFLDEGAMEALCEGADAAVDALGGRRDRPALSRAARKAGIPLVTGAAAGLTGYVAVVAPDGPGPEDFFGGPAGPAAEDDLGCPGPGVAAVAALQAAEVLKILCGREPALTGSMLLIDLGDMSFERVRL